MISGIANLLARDEAAWGFSGLLVLIFAVVLFRFLRRTRGLASELRAGIAVLKKAEDRSDFLTKFDDLSDELAAIPALSRAWREFLQELIIPEQGSAATISNSKAPAEHFTLESLAAGRLSIRFYSGFSNMLVGLGIFGTFLGLAAGIYLVSRQLSGTAEELKLALGGLLGGAFLSFLKSAVGILLSILFTIMERRALGSLEDGIHVFCSELEKRLQLQTPERLAQQQLRELCEQTASLKQFNTGLAPHLAEALDQRISGRLEPALQRLHQALLDIKAERASTDQQFLARSLDEFRRSMQGAAGREMDGLGSTLHVLSETIDRSASALQAGQQQFEGANARIADGIERTLETARNGIHQQLQDLAAVVTSSVSKSAEALTTQLEAGGRALVQQVGVQNEQLGMNARQLEQLTGTWTELLAGASSLTERTSVVADSLATAHSQFTATTDALRAVEKSVRVASERLEALVHEQGTHAGTLSAASTTINESLKATAASWSEYQRRFADLDRSLGSVFEQIDGGLARYSEKIREYVRDVETQMARATENLAGTVGQLSDDLSELPSEVKELGSHVKALKDSVRPQN